MSIRRAMPVILTADPVVSREFSGLADFMVEDQGDVQWAASWPRWAMMFV